jgi:uncharacterized protein
MTAVQHLAGETFHARRGGVENAFRYRVDYVLLDMESDEGPGLFARNAGGLVSLWDSDHGGAPKLGHGVTWVRGVLAAHALPGGDSVRLLAQPRVLGHVFNPVSFWLCSDSSELRVVIAEVSNTYGDRHCYLCHREDLGVIRAEDHIAARKIFHVSPFQPVEGGYEFRFDVTAERIGIFIDYTAGKGGLVATLVGKLEPLTNAGIVATCLRRPFGSRRVLALIHWQALKLWWKGARFHSRPVPPVDKVSR